MADENEDRSLAQWATEGLQPEPAPEPVAEAAPEPEPVAEAVAEEQPAAEATEPAEVVPEAEAAPEPAKPAKAKPKPLEPWVKDRLAEMTAKQREAERKAAEAEARARVLEAEAAALRKRQAPAEATADPAPANVETLPPRGDYVPASEVEARAARIAEERAMNAKADQTYYAGKAAYEDFDAAIAPLQEMGAFTRPEFYQAIFETEAPQDVLYHLGSNPNEASRIIGLLKSGNLVKATVELAKVDARLSAEKATPKTKPRPTSNAPAPIKPVGGSANPAAVPLDKMDDDAFTQELSRMSRERGWGF